MTFPPPVPAARRSELTVLLIVTVEASALIAISPRFDWTGPSAVIELSALTTETDPPAAWFRTPTPPVAAMTSAREFTAS